MTHVSNLIVPAILSTAVASPIAAEQLAIDYYGVVAESTLDGTELNMLKMAQDIFFTQLKSIDSITVSDKRPDSSKTSLSIPDFQGSSVAFYAEIGENVSENGKTWTCRFSAFDPSDEITHSKTETYDSYYKILSGAKSAIESVISDFKKDENEKKAVVVAKTESPRTFDGNIDIESLAGTWSGEPFTDKILILRGGRGFIIFKNGATMNIKISAKKIDSRGNVSEIEVRQIGKSNASFFPELPRQTALNLAATASPIVWNFTIRAGELYGTKRTIIPATNALGAEEGTVVSTWSKK